MSETDGRKGSGRKPLRRPDAVAMPIPEKRNRYDSPLERRSSRDSVAVKVTEDNGHDSSSSSSSSSGRRHKLSHKPEKSGDQPPAPWHSSKRSKGTNENEDERRKRKKKEKKQRRETESGQKPKKNKKQKRFSPRSVSPEEADLTNDERAMRPPTSGGIFRASNKVDEYSSTSRVDEEEKRKRKKQERELLPESRHYRHSRYDDRRQEAVSKRRSRSPLHETSARSGRNNSKVERQKEYLPSSPSGVKRVRISDRSSKHRSHRARSRSRSVSKPPADKNKPTSSGLPSLLSKRGRSSVLAGSDNFPMLTLVKQLILEVTSDTEFDALLPEGLLNGEMAKLSMGGGVRAKNALLTAASIPEFVIGGGEKQSNGNELTFNKPQEDSDVDEKECLDRMLGSLSDELQAKSLCTETWDSGAGTSATSSDFDLETANDLDPEELGTLAASGAMASALRLATASANGDWRQSRAGSLLAQRLLSNISTPWQTTVNEKSEEASDNHSEEASVTTGDEFQKRIDQQIGLQFLNMAGFSSRHLGAALTADLQSTLALFNAPHEVKRIQRRMPHIFPSTDNSPPSSISPFHSPPLPIVQTVDVELAWRKRLLGLPTAAV